MFNTYQLAVAESPSPPTTKLAQWGLRLLYMLIVLGCGARLYEVWQHNPLDSERLYSDAMRHWEQASEPLEPSPLALFDQPFFQLWLSVIQKWTMGLRPLIALYAGLLSIATPWLWYRFLREATSSRALALMGWALLVWLPTWFSIYSFFMTETLFLALMGASLWATLRADRKRTMSAFIVMVVLWLLTGLTRAIGLPLGTLAGLLVWLRYPHKLRCVGWSVLIVLVVLAPLSYRNYYFLHLWTPWGNGWMNNIYAESGKREVLLHLRREGAAWEYGFTTPSMNKQPLMPLSDWTPSRTGTVDIHVDMTHGEEDWKKESKRTAIHGSERLKMYGENILDVMMGSSWPDDQPYLAGQMSFAFRWPWAPLFLIVVVMAALRWRNTLARPLLPSLIAVWFILQACTLVAVNEGRYRKPLEGLLIAEIIIMWDQSRKRAIPAIT